MCATAQNIAHSLPAAMAVRGPVLVSPSQPFHEMSLDERIRANGWFDGTMDDWYELPLEQREQIAFAATGCSVAYPTWARPVDCVHTRCRILRGELPPIAYTIGQLRHERESGWLRFMKDEKQVGAMFRYYLCEAARTGVYDIWQIGWQGLVLAGISN